MAVAVRCVRKNRSISTRPKPGKFRARFLFQTDESRHQFDAFFDEATGAEREGISVVAGPRPTEKKPVRRMAWKMQQGKRNATK